MMLLPVAIVELLLFRFLPVARVELLLLRLLAVLELKDLLRDKDLRSESRLWELPVLSPRTLRTPTLALPSLPNLLLKSDQLSYSTFL